MVRINNNNQNFTLITHTHTPSEQLLKKNRNKHDKTAATLNNVTGGSNVFRGVKS